MRAGVVVCDRFSGRSTFPNCFSGKDAITWLAADRHCGGDRALAAAVASRLHRAGFFHAAGPDGAANRDALLVYDSPDAFYRFFVDEDRLYRQFWHAKHLPPHTVFPLSLPTPGSRASGEYMLGAPHTTSAPSVRMQLEAVLSDAPRGLLTASVAAAAVAAVTTTLYTAVAAPSMYVADACAWRIQPHVACNSIALSLGAADALLGSAHATATCGKAAAVLAARLSGALTDTPGGQAAMSSAAAAAAATAGKRRSLGRASGIPLPPRVDDVPRVNGAAAAAFNERSGSGTGRQYDAESSVVLHDDDSSALSVRTPTFTSTSTGGASPLLRASPTAAHPRSPGLGVSLGGGTSPRSVRSLVRRAFFGSRAEAVAARPPAGALYRGRTIALPPSIPEDEPAEAAVGAASRPARGGDARVRDAANASREEGRLAVQLPLPTGVATLQPGSPPTTMTGVVASDADRDPRQVVWKQSGEALPDAAAAPRSADLAGPSAKAFNQLLQLAAQERRLQRQQLAVLRDIRNRVRALAADVPSSAAVRKAVGCAAVPPKWFPLAGRSSRYVSVSRLMDGGGGSGSSPMASGTASASASPVAASSDQVMFPTYRSVAVLPASPDVVLSHILDGRLRMAWDEGFARGSGVICVVETGAASAFEALSAVPVQLPPALSQATAATAQGDATAAAAPSPPPSDNRNTATALRIHASSEEVTRVRDVGGYGTEPPDDNRRSSVKVTLHGDIAAALARADMLLQPPPVSQPTPVERVARHQLTHMTSVPVAAASLRQLTGSGSSNERGSASAAMAQSRLGGSSSGERTTALTLSRESSHPTTVGSRNLDGAADFDAGGTSPPVTMPIGPALIADYFTINKTSPSLGPVPVQQSAGRLAGMMDTTAAQGAPAALHDKLRDSTAAAADISPPSFALDDGTSSPGVISAGRSRPGARTIEQTVTLTPAVQRSPRQLPSTPVLSAYASVSTSSTSSYEAVRRSPALRYELDAVSSTIASRGTAVLSVPTKVGPTSGGSDEATGTSITSLLARVFGRPKTATTRQRQHRGRTAPGNSDSDDGSPVAPQTRYQSPHPGPRPPQQQRHQAEQRQIVPIIPATPPASTLYPRSSSGNLNPSGEPRSLPTQDTRNTAAATRMSDGGPRNRNAALPTSGGAKGAGKGADLSDIASLMLPRGVVVPRVLYRAFRPLARALVAPRDAVVLQDVGLWPDGTIVVVEFSIQHRDVPLSSGDGVAGAGAAVRAEVLLEAHVLEPVAVPLDARRAASDVDVASTLSMPQTGAHDVAVSTSSPINRTLTQHNSAVNLHATTTAPAPSSAVSSGSWVPALHNVIKSTPAVTVVAANVTAAVRTSGRFSSSDSDSESTVSSTPNSVLRAAVRRRSSTGGSAPTSTTPSTVATSISGRNNFTAAESVSSTSRERFAASGAVSTASGSVEYEAVASRTEERRHLQLMQAADALGEGGPPRAVAHEPDRGLPASSTETGATIRAQPHLPGLSGARRDSVSGTSPSVSVVGATIEGATAVDADCVFYSRVTRITQINLCGTLPQWLSTALVDAQTTLPLENLRVAVAAAVDAAAAAARSAEARRSSDLPGGGIDPTGRRTAGWVAGPTPDGAHVSVPRPAINGSGMQLQSATLPVRDAALAAAHRARRASPRKRRLSTALLLAHPHGVPLAAVFGRDDDDDWRGSGAAEYRMSISDRTHAASGAAQLAASTGVQKTHVAAQHLQKSYESSTNNNDEFDDGEATAWFSAPDDELAALGGVALSLDGNVGTDAGNASPGDHGSLLARHTSLVKSVESAGSSISHGVDGAAAGVFDAHPTVGLLHVNVSPDLSNRIAVGVPESGDDDATQLLGSAIAPVPNTASRTAILASAGASIAGTGAAHRRPTLPRSSGSDAADNDEDGDEDGDDDEDDDVDDDDEYFDYEAEGYVIGEPVGSNSASDSDNDNDGVTMTGTGADSASPNGAPCASTSHHQLHLDGVSASVSGSPAVTAILPSAHVSRASERPLQQATHAATVATRVVQAPVVPLQRTVTEVAPALAPAAADSTTARTLFKNRVGLADFELLAVLGRGGYGKVLQVRRVRRVLTLNVPPGGPAVAAAFVAALAVDEPGASSAAFRVPGANALSTRRTHRGGEFVIRRRLPSDSPLSAENCAAVAGAAGAALLRRAAAAAAAATARANTRGTLAPSLLWNDARVRLAGSQSRGHAANSGDDGTEATPADLIVQYREPPPPDEGMHYAMKVRLSMAGSIMLLFPPIASPLFTCNGAHVRIPQVLRKRDLIARRQVARTLTERRILTELSHPFLVSLRYAFTSHAKLYMVSIPFSFLQLCLHVTPCRPYSP